VKTREQQRDEARERTYDIRHRLGQRGVVIVDLADGDPARTVDALDMYVELFWLPILGPSAYLAHRRLVQRARLDGSGCLFVDLSVLGTEIGLGPGSGAASSIVKTLTRLCEWNFAALTPTRFTVRNTVPRLTEKQVKRLPDSLREIHEMAVRRG